MVAKKDSKDKIIKTIVDVMLGHRGLDGKDGFSPWAHKIMVVCDPSGKRKPCIADDDQVITLLTVEGVASEILAYIDSNHTDYLVDHDLATKIVKTYLLRATPIEDVSLTREINEPGYCYHRQPYNMLQWEITEEEMQGTCELFHEWLGRVKHNKQAVVHWLGSLFVPQATNQQYLVLKGEGMDGKGALLNCLADFFGPTFASTFGEKVKGDRWTTSTLNKRVVAFPDAQNLAFLNSEVFKSITGGNPVPYRFLYQEEFSAPSEAFFIVCTNEDVDVTGMKSDRRRRIYAEMESARTQVKDYQQNLKDEAQIFFSYCRQQYLKNCEIGMPIPVDDSVEDNLEADSWDQFDLFFEDHLTNRPEGSMPRADLYHMFINNCDRRNMMFKRFKYYLRKKWGAEEKRIDGIWRIKGVRRRLEKGTVTLVKQ